VTQGYGVRVRNAQDGSVLERTFAKLPIRIGRNALNDLQLDLPVVSEFHAVIESSGQRIMLRDLGSTNGTLLRSTGRVPPNQYVDLAPHGYEFAIVSLVFQVYTLKLEGPVSLRFDPAPAPPPPQPGTFVQAYQAYRAAWNVLMDALTRHVMQQPPTSRAYALQQFVQSMPALVYEPDFRRLAASVGAQLPDVAQAAAMQEAIALRGLQEIARDLTGGVMVPETPDQLSRFASKLKNALTVFTRAFIPLRDGYRQFAASVALRHEDQGPPSAAEKARTPQELAARLLDWNRADDEEAAAIESSFADLLIHQVAMLNGVMSGVRSLLNELAPQSLEQALNDPRVRKPENPGIGPYRFRALWRLYEQRHGDLVSEDRHVFALLFGPQFAEAYARFHGNTRHTQPVKR
jgi:type VI secretion system protein ImpI